MLQGLYDEMKQKSVFVRCEQIFMSTTAEGKLAGKNCTKGKKKCPSTVKLSVKTHMFYGLWKLELCATGTHGTVGQSL